MNILALDASTKSTGWSIKNGDIRESGCIASASTSIEKRIAYMRDEILKLIKKYNIDTIIIEEVHAEYTHNSTVNQKLNWLQGCLRVAVWEYDKNIKIETILPNSWRSAIGIHTGRGVTRDKLKAADIEYVKNNYNKTVNDDEADAICILDAYLVNGTTSTQKIKANSIPTKSAF